MGIKGLITDATTNEPLEGVFVHVHGDEHITISDAHGEYFRLLPAGPYKVTFELSEYKNRTISVLVDNILNQANPFNVRMDRNLDDFEELKSPGVLAAREQEEKNNLNRTFTGEYRKIRNDFESLPVFKYRNYDEMMGYMLYYHQKYPEITWIYKIESWKAQNKKLPYVFVISTNPDRHELLKPEFKYTANSFATDWIGKELLLLLIKHLLESYDVNPEITRLINTTRIHIIPSFDPESYEVEYAKYRKTNQRSIKQPDVCATNETVESLDLIFPDIISKTADGYKDDIARFITWLDENAFLLSGTLYDGQLLARIPLNTFAYKNDTTRTNEDQLFRELAGAYVQVRQKICD